MRPIFIAASPNSEADDKKIALKSLFQPWKWFDDSKTRQFEQEMEQFLGLTDACVALDSARSAFYLLLKAYGIGPGDEVMLPAFSCLVVANPVIWVGAKPIYLDIDENTYNASLNDIKQKLTKNTKAILVQHTFGNIIDIEQLRKAVPENVLLIEDAAHAFGGEVNSKKVGTLADAAILTFGIEKAISTVRGGMVVVKDAAIYEKLKLEQATLPRFSWLRVKIALINPLLWGIFTPIYYLGVAKLTLGRLFVSLAHKLGLLGNMIEKCEYDTEKPDWLPAKMPGVLANLGLNQLEKIDRFRQHRFKIASFYDQELNGKFAKSAELNYLRYPLQVEEPQKLSRMAKAKGIVLGDWYKNILYAPDASLRKLGYEKGMTPVAEKVAKRIINLPLAVNIGDEDAKRVIQVVKEYKHAN